MLSHIIDIILHFTNLEIMQYLAIVSEGRGERVLDALVILTAVIVSSMQLVVTTKLIVAT